MLRLIQAREFLEVAIRTLPLNIFAANLVPIHQLIGTEFPKGRQARWQSRGMILNFWFSVNSGQTTLSRWPSMNSSAMKDGLELEDPSSQA